MPVFTLKLNQSQPTAHRHSVFLLWPKKKTKNWVDLIKKKVLLGKVRGHAMSGESQVYGRSSVAREVATSDHVRRAASAPQP